MGDRVHPGASPSVAASGLGRGEAEPSAGFTPGPWGWFGQGGYDLYLATKHSGRRYVMGFRRMGLQGAQPVFQINSRMVPASDLLQFEVGDRDVVGLAAAKADASVYRYDVRGINCADARLIAAAPDLYEALAALVGDHTTGGTWRTEGDALDRARAALASARGQGPRVAAQVERDKSRDEQ